MKTLNVEPLRLVGWTAADAAEVRRRRAAARKAIDEREGGPPCDDCDGVRCATCERPQTRSESLEDVSLVDVLDLVEDDRERALAACEAFERRPQKSTLADVLREFCVLTGFDTGETDGAKFSLDYGGTTYAVTISIPRNKE